LTGLSSCAACSTSATVAALSTSTARSPRTTAASVFATPRLARLPRLACFCQARISISIFSAPGRLNCRQGQRANIEQRNSDNEDQLLGRKSH